MTNRVQRFLTQAPWMGIFVGVLASSLLGDGLRDALDPEERVGDMRSLT